MKAFNIMVVDDNELVLDLVAHHVRKAGAHTVITYKSAVIALEHFDQAIQNPDIVFCDLNMPEMDGIEFIRHLSTRKYSGGIVFISGVESRILRTVEKLATEHRLKVYGSIEKPITLDNVKNLLERIQNRQEKTVVLPDSFIPTKADIEIALAEDQLEVFFQPKVNATNYVIVAVESLVRWRHPEHGLIDPNRFIRLAEENQLIDQLTDTVVRKSIEQLSLWMHRGLVLKLAVNVSIGSLLRLDFPEIITRIIKDVNIQPSQIILEITESKLMQDLALCMEILSRLRLKGYALSIDDFGTGYSTLEQLQRIPFDELKIDRTFVSGSNDDPASKAILESSCMLAKKLGMTIVAEGVETVEEWQRVVDLGCDLVQGYYVSQPMPAEQFEQWVISNGRFTPP